MEQKKIEEYCKEQTEELGVWVIPGELEPMKKTELERVCVMCYSKEVFGIATETDEFLCEKHFKINLEARQTDYPRKFFPGDRR